MAQRKYKADWSLAAAPPPPAFAAELTARPAAAAGSPARALQQLLEQSTAPAVEVEQWSRRRQIAFITASACALWMALLVASAELVRAIA